MSGIDFIALHDRYQVLAKADGGFRSQLGKRIGHPDELYERPAFYQLFVGYKELPKWAARVAFMLPCCRHAADAKPLGAQLAAAKVGEARVMQVARAGAPNDLIQLRRLLMRIEPTVNWAEFGWTLVGWETPEKKRQLIADFFIGQSIQTK